MKKELGKGTDFYEFITDWNEKVKAYTAVDRLFLSAGNKYLVGFGLATAIAVFFYFVVISNYFPQNEFPLASKLNLLIAVLHQLDQKIIYPHYDFKHLTEKYFEIGMKLNDFSIQFSTSPTGSENHLSPLRFQTFNRKVF